LSVETIVAISVAGGGLIVACFTGGIVFGVLKGKVDTCQRDVNHAFRMIRELQNQKGSDE